MSTARHHAEWLSLTEISGPFLSMPVLSQAFPQGLDKHEPDHARLLRQAFEEWDENQSSGRPDPAIHNAWIRYVLANTLDLEEILLEGQSIPQTLKAAVPEQGETLRPDYVVNEPGNGKPRLLVRVYPRTQKLTKPVAQARWKASPDTRMMELLHRTDVRLGLITNGDQWMLVNAPSGETSGYASWYSVLWFEEPITLRAFRTLLCATRFFGVPDDETPERLLTRSAADQQEVTDQLGYQVRRAVEVIIQTLDKADQDHGRELLGDIPEEVLYEAALTIMMRLVFLFCAEERELLLLGDELYDKNYAVSTLREQLQETADQFGEEILERRKDAWNRLLTTFRVVYGGVEHDRFRMPAYGGNLFDPDRFPFLEGRKPGTSWRDEPANPLPVDNRTVLHLLQALQILEVKMPGRGPVEAQRLSFRALDIEQIGHVYEGLLDHTAIRATEPVLGLSGTRDKEPEIPLSELERLREKGEKEFHEYLKKQTGRSSAATIKRALAAEVDGHLLSRFRTVCHGNDELWQRIEPFAGLVRIDTFGYPVVIPSGSVYVTAGTDRRSSGTHYTPRSLTEPIVQYTLEPLVYEGPAEGKPKEEWKLRSPAELLELNICDMACGSGAFLVQACRYLSERLMEAWEEAEKQHPGTIRITPHGQPSTGKPGDMLIPKDTDERDIYARRIVAGRCLYGVDKNPLACEMAKLSLWLLTLAKDMPFTFLDHAIRCGDSLVGISNTEQLERFSLNDGETQLQFAQEAIRKRLDATRLLRRQIEERFDSTVEDTEQKALMLKNADQQIRRLAYAADHLIAVHWQPMSETERERILSDTLRDVEFKFKDLPVEELDKDGEDRLLEVGIERTFHWPLEFPEVFDRGGFDAFVCNPPFMGAKKITGALGQSCRDYLIAHLADSTRGHADICAYFFLRAADLLRSGGQFGFIATNTIGQGETREIGLERLLSEGCTIPRAVPSRKWPGNATVEVANVWIRQGSWEGATVLDDRHVSGIDAFLAVPGLELGDPFDLAEDDDLAFQGSNIRGVGFILEPEEAAGLISDDPRNRDVLFPYVIGQDVNLRPDQSPSRWVINFFDWDREKADSYPRPFSIVREKVLPERQKIKHAASRKKGAEFFWKYDSQGKSLYRAIEGLDHVLIRSRVSNLHAIARLKTGIVFSDATVVFAFQTLPPFSVLQSSFHETWLLKFSSTMRTDVRYTPSSCFDTFPFPSGVISGSSSHQAELESIGTKMYGYRSTMMLASRKGLTKTYNRFHDSDETATDIQKLRELHVEMDQAVAAAYGWTDLDLDHGFHETKQGLRYTISEEARREVLGRLLKLNHERYEEEVKQGLHDKKRKKKTARKRTSKKKPEGPTLFD